LLLEVWEIPNEIIVLFGGYRAMPTVLFANTLWKNAKLFHDQPTPQMEDVALDFFLYMSLEEP
jgi:hypothetical protein